MLLALSTLLVLPIAIQTDAKTPSPTPITVGQEITGSVTIDEPMEFVISAKAGDYIHGVVLALDGDVAVDVKNQGHDLPLTFDCSNADYDEPFCFQVVEDGSHVIKVFSGNGKVARFLLYLGFQGKLGTTPVEIVQHYLRMQPPSQPGNGMAVIEDGKIEFIGVGGVTHVDGKEPLSVATPFVSEELLLPMVASAFYLLQSQEKLPLYRSVNHHLGWFHSYPSGIRLEDVLEGNSRLPSVGGLRQLQEWDDDATVSEQEARDFLSQELMLAPSRKYRVRCDSDIFLLLEVLSAMTGKDHDGAMKEVLFDPLGMTNASLISGDSLLPQVSASLEDVATWMAEMQKTESRGWNLMQRLASLEILENYMWLDS